MNYPRVLLTLFTSPKQIALELHRSFHGTLALKLRGIPVNSGFNKSSVNPLFLTNLPKAKREKKPKIPKKPIPSGKLIIKCKRPELNHYSGMIYGKFDTVPLASKGWRHWKSKGDYFTILPSSWHPAFVTKEDLPDTFEGNGVSEKVIKQLAKLNMSHPTVIQAKACQHLLNGKNVFISAECGSGKTLGYLIALIENVLKWKSNINDNANINDLNAPIGIILLPSRELAIQVGILAEKLGSDLGITCQTLIGGNIENLLQNPTMAPVDILTCTLQVFLKHMKANLYSTSLCKHVVVDEADTFLDSSFIGQFKQFLNESKLEFTGFGSNNYNNQCAQICFASATVPKEMEEKLLSLIKGNHMVTVTTHYLHKTISYAHQTFKRVSKKGRPEELLRIVKSNLKAKIPTMIFSNRITTAAWVCEFLNNNNVDCGSITTDIYAANRLEHFRDFEGGITNVISCTDLASRGLSFSRVKHVINFEFPTFMIDYIHRCGRTGRLNQGNDCKVTSFICSRHEVHFLNKIELAVRTNIPLTGIHQNRILHNSKQHNF